MRNKLDTRRLEAIAIESMNDLEREINWKNSAGEIFVFLGGEMIQYTDTRVIEHESDQLVNLAENPIDFAYQQELLSEQRLMAKELMAEFNV